MGLRHPVTPGWMSDLKLKVAIDADIVGEKYFPRDRKCAACPRCARPDSCAHKFGLCGQAERAWRLMLRDWEHATGEHLSPEDPWVTMWGARWHLATVREHARWSSPAHVETFHAVHSAMIVALDEHHRRPAPGSGLAVYQRARVILHSLAEDTRKYRPARFQERWETSSPDASTTSSTSVGSVHTRHAESSQKHKKPYSTPFRL